MGRDWLKGPHSPLPWRIEVSGVWDGEPTWKVVDANGNTVLDDEPYYAHAVKLSNMQLIIAMVNGGDE